MVMNAELIQIADKLHSVDGQMKNSLVEMLKLVLNFGLNPIIHTLDSDMIQQKILSQILVMLVDIVNRVSQLSPVEIVHLLLNVSKLPLLDLILMDMIISYKILIDV